MSETLDVAVVGAGAAGLATAIFAARRGRSVVAFDGATKLGAKILVSGGGRCNVTNARVVPGDFRGGSSNVVRQILDAFPVGRTVAFFREIGVPLHEEEDGKLFPDSNSARTVLEALVREAGRTGVRFLTGHRVSGVGIADGRLRVETSRGAFGARRVVLATGGMSVPKSGSDGTGYRLAVALGHTIVPPVPALVPLVLEGDFHAPLSGIAQPVEIAVRSEGSKPVRVRGAMLWTHFGVSGPAALDVSRFWLRDRSARVTANLLPGLDFASAEKGLVGLAREQPRSQLRNALATLLPAQVAAAVVAKLGLRGETPMSHLPREDRRALVRSLLEWPLPVRDSRGYDYAEVTAGGVPLTEIEPRTLASRRCPGLYLVGEILDVDGRIGGFNFQWAWSSAWVAASAPGR
ncbi:MAG: NAD(P)/FAD-dependent oxidoreductase [Planctomycetes bacterium]|nr:NAD(P)/FAD-dependent oxidoreductase [Planctomycetota bacterium]